MKRGLMLVPMVVTMLLTAGVAQTAAAGAEFDPPFVCRPERPKLIKDTGQPAGPIFVMQANDGNGHERMEVSARMEGGGYRATWHTVEPKETEALCEAGYSVAVAPSPRQQQSGSDRPKAVAQYPLLSSFSVVQLNGAVYGNFWTPGLLPAGHGAHVVDFTVQMSNHENAAPGTHFVNSITLITDDFVTFHHGRGLIFGPAGSLCAAPWGLYSMGQHWSNTRDSAGITTEFGGVFVPGAQRRLQPNTCAAMTPSSSYRFLNGANAQLQSKYYRYPAGSWMPDFWSNILYSSSPIYPPGYAGVAFLSVSFPGSAPNWALTFYNVSQYTL